MGTNKSNKLTFLQTTVIIVAMLLSFLLIIYIQENHFQNQWAKAILFFYYAIAGPAFIAKVILNDIGGLQNLPTDQKWLNGVLLLFIFISSIYIIYLQ